MRRSQHESLRLESNGWTVHPPIYYRRNNDISTHTETTDLLYVYKILDFTRHKHVSGEEKDLGYHVDKILVEEEDMKQL